MLIAEEQGSDLKTVSEHIGKQQTMPRLDVIYLALQTTRAKAIIDLLAEDTLLVAARNGAYRELAEIVDRALAEEVARRAREDGV